MPQLSSPLTSPVTPSFNQSQSSNVDTSLLKGFFDSSLSQTMSVNQSVSTHSSPYVSVSSTNDSVTTHSREDGLMARDTSVNNKKIGRLLNLLWEDSNDGGNETMREKIQSLKRKAEMDSSDSEQNNPGGVTSSQASKLSKENVLLTQLLSKKASSDIIVNTLSTIQPSGIPQPRKPSNIASKFLKVNPSSFTSTFSGPKEAKRPRLESSNSSQTSTLEQALSAPKQDIHSISSTQSFDALMETGPDSNSGISNISESSVSSQIKDDLQQILLSAISDTSTTSNVTEVNLEDNADPLLAQILQQAQDLQQDLTSGSFPNVNQNVPQNLLFDSSVNNSAQPVGNNSNFQSNANSGIANQRNTVDLIQQIELALNDSNFNLNDVDSLLNPGNTSMSSVDEQIAIDAIQKQLMMDMPGMSSSTSVSSVQTPPIQSGRIQPRFGENVSMANMSSASQIKQNLLANQPPGRMPNALRNQFQNQGPGPLRQNMATPRSGRPMQQLPGYNPAAPTGQNFPGQGPRLPPPQGKYSCTCKESGLKEIRNVIFIFQILLLRFVYFCL